MARPLRLWVLMGSICGFVFLLLGACSSGESVAVEATPTALVVDAGQNVDIRLGATALLSASIVKAPSEVQLANGKALQAEGEDEAVSPESEDTGTPAVGWSQVEGPAPVAISEPESPTTHASFTLVGVYVLKFTAREGNLTGSDTVSITVSDAADDGVDDDAPSTPSSPDGTIYYVSTEGSDENAGDRIDRPFKTLHKAGTVVQPGDVIQLRGGVYYEYNDYGEDLDFPQTSFMTSGTADAPIVIESYPGEWAIIDGSRKPDGGPMTFDMGPSNPYRPYLLYLPVDHYVVRNLEFRNSAGNAIASTPHMFADRGNFNTFQNLYLHHNHSDGLYVGGVNNDKMAEGNVVEYVVSHHNQSTRNGGDSADGVKMPYTRDGVIRNSIFYKNSDDGMDFYGSEDTVVESTVSWLNGYFWKDGDTDPFGTAGQMEAATGNGNGFKLAGRVENNKVTGNVAVRNIAFWNKLYGFNYNNGAGVHFYNNTSFANSYGGFSAKCFGSLVLKNNLSYDEINVVKATGGNCPDGTMPDEDHNSWNMGDPNPLFDSLSVLSPSFVALTEKSPVIDQGVPVGMSFAGAAPDLGALEFGETIVELGLPFLDAIVFDGPEDPIRALLEDRADRFN